MQLDRSFSDEAILEELGGRISRHRLKQNLTQKELADEAGIGVNTVYRLEQGHSTQLSNLIRILRILRLVTNFDLLVPESPPSPIEQAKMKKKERKRATTQKELFTPSMTWNWEDQK